MWSYKKKLLGFSHHCGEHLDFFDPYPHKHTCSYTSMIQPCSSTILPYVLDHIFLFTIWPIFISKLYHLWSMHRIWVYLYLYMIYEAQYKSLSKFDLNVSLIWKIGPIQFEGLKWIGSALFRFDEEKIISMQAQYCLNWFWGILLASPIQMF